MTEHIKTRFLELKVTGQRFSMSPETIADRDRQLICFLKQVIENREVTDFEDVGFCLWNISDNYSFIKDGHSLMHNHKIFYNHIEKENWRYLYWLVNDASQRLTLEKYGYSSFWWTLYQDAMEKNTTDTCFFAQYHVHRAALYKCDALPHTQENLVLARTNFEKFLNKTVRTPEYSFYKTMYASQMAQFGEVDTKALITAYERLLRGISQPDIASDYLPGEWKKFVIPFSIRRQAVIGITSIVNALINCNETERAKEIYMDACVKGLPRNRYVESRLPVVEFG